MKCINWRYVKRLTFPLIISIIFVVSCYPKGELGKPIYKDEGKLKFYKATPSKPIDTDFFTLTLEGQNIVLIWNSNNVDKIPKYEKWKVINLILDQGYSIEDLWYTKYGNDLILVYGVRVGDGATSYVARLEGQQYEVIWTTQMYGFNIGEPVIIDRYIYLSTIGFVGKLDIQTGKYAWKHGELYDRKTYSFNVFEKPVFEKNLVVFPEYNPFIKIPKKLKLNNQTGEIIDICPINQTLYNQIFLEYNNAIENRPKDAEAYLNRGIAHESIGLYKEAISDCNKAIEINPAYGEAYNSLAWLHATAGMPHFRNGKKAIELSLKACELSEWKDPNYLDTLAAAYARVGDFQSAVKWQSKALESPEFAKDKKAQNRLNFYLKRQAWPSD